jgi:hypothetical protein
MRREEKKFQTSKRKRNNKFEDIPIGSVMVVNNAALIKGVFKVRKISIRVNKKPERSRRLFSIAQW